MSRTLKTVITVICIAFFAGMVLLMLWGSNKAVSGNNSNITGTETMEEKDIFDYVSMGNTDGVIEELNKGTDINVINIDNNRTLLHYALGYEQTEIAKYLIEQGIDKDVKDAYGDTPIMLAVYTGNKEIFSLLVDDVDLNVTDAMGNSLLHLAAAADDCDVYNELVEKGLSVYAENQSGKTSLYYCGSKEMLENVMRHMKLESLDVALATELLFSAVTPEIVDYLVDELGVSVNTLDADGNNALYYSMMNGTPEVFERLIKKGIDVDNVNNEGNTILHICAFENLVDFAQMLVEGNADKSILNADNLTAYEIAQEYQSKEIIELLGNN